MSDVSDYRTLVKSKQYIDLPGESPKAKLWPGVNNVIILRKHRDVVFDIKLGTGATYTVTTDRPQSEYGRFYDPKRNLNVIKVTFKDGEPCHLWVGRTFEGCLILKQGEKELGRYPIRKMDCTQGCTEDPKDKPAPMLIIMHDDKAFAKELLTLQDAALPSSKPPAGMMAALDRARRKGGLQDSPFSDRPQPSVATLVDTHGLTMTRDGQQEVLQMAHLFEVKPTNGHDVPEEILQFFVSGNEKFQIDPGNTLSRNWILGQMAVVGGYLRDAMHGDEGWLRKFWRRKFFLQRSGGKFVLLFSTGPEDFRTLGVLLVGYRRVVPHGSQIMTIAGGAGSLGGTARAAWSASQDSIRHGAGLALAITITVDAMVWFNDYREGKKDLYDLLAALGIDMLKAGLVAGVTSAIVSTLLTVAAGWFISSVAVSVLSIAIGTIAVAIVVAYAVDWMFNHTKANERFTNLIREAGKIIEEATPRDYGNAYTTSEWEIAPGSAMSTQGLHK